MRPVVCLLLAGMCVSAIACNAPPCTSFNGFSSGRSIVGNATCCVLCEAGNRCNGRNMTACNVSAGEYQPAAGQSTCLVAASCSAGTWKSQPGTSTYAHTCSFPSVCDTLSQVEIAAPTPSTDRVCACIAGWVGTTQCHRCTSLIPGCVSCIQQMASVACVKCAPDYTMTDTTLPNVTCIPCAVARCAACNRPNHCSQCTGSVILSEGKCGCTDPNCETCIDECTKCKHPYAFDTAGSCSLCVATHARVDGECVLVTTTTAAAATVTSTHSSMAAPATTQKGASGLPVYITAAVSVLAAVACMVVAVVMYRYILRRRVTAAAAAHQQQQSSGQDAPALPVRAFPEPDRLESSYLLPILANASSTGAGGTAHPIYDTVAGPDDFPLYDLATTDPDTGYVDVEM